MIIAAGAVAGLERCRRFLAARDRRASQRAAAEIRRHFSALERLPGMGRPVGREGLRELVIPFGAAGYVALYRHEPDEDRVLILAFRHQREAGY
ncbi:type II toxin-antitoxin system RelE/ParE family toxin [Phreatobacter cathodiphilus]|uniref:type II toxin-antitoxin system RelE/ParE family toxin n=1 Tax=Phreatobacter cathodiphilus TaxID=1868589 RepID=UPI001FEB012E|nr:type II toxin-antitoxin system RelE/ParE family toxin [Phreatobacter cathodiphilus]